MVAVHSTARGPALGGCRMWTYDDARAAVRDVLRLSRAMTFKAAVAGLPLGGGKGVIMLRPADGPLDGARRRAALLDFAEIVDALGGRYLTAEDVGMSTPRHEGDRRAHAPRHRPLAAPRRVRRPEPCTALGVEAAIAGALERALGDAALTGRSIAVVGLGHVGCAAGRRLRAAGAQLIVADIDPAKRELAERLGARWVDARGRAARADVDVVAPCALGGVLDETTVPALRCRGDRRRRQQPARRRGRSPTCSHARGILWAPDFVANAGGIINIAVELGPAATTPRAPGATWADRRHPARDLRPRRARGRDAADRGDGARPATDLRSRAQGRAPRCRYSPHLAPQLDPPLLATRRLLGRRFALRGRPLASAPVDALESLDVARLRADNAGPFTLSGTNTWIVGRDPAYVIDPGPLLEPHLEAIVAETDRRGGIAGIALTHAHPDHSEAVAALRERTFEPALAAADPEADIVLADGAAFGPLTAIATPGHSPDHIAYSFGSACFTGDAVLGEGSVFVADYPGALRGYLGRAGAPARAATRRAVPRARAAGGRSRRQDRRLPGPPRGSRAPALAALERGLRTERGSAGRRLGRRARRSCGGRRRSRCARTWASCARRGCCRPS